MKTVIRMMELILFFMAPVMILALAVFMILCCM